ncbi:tetratricopeptide repeat protein [Streptomyces sp. ST2-7A]|nr:AfsR/SARP family transcriptional regulator [Streptomyces sp. ST2-7A]MCE7079029.1 tetratricopeptide repeat protein [Streptomyces sp. ST2-7A]
MEFLLLGPVRVLRDGVEQPAGPPQQRALLATLLLHDGHPVGVSELVDSLWDEDPPLRAVAALRTYASRLRRLLAPRSEVLVSEAGGYALRPGPGDRVDLAELDELCGLAERASLNGDAAEAHRLYGRALALWDGEALTGVPGPAADTHRNRLTERRLVLRELHLCAALECGLHVESVSDLTALTSSHPMRETLRELLMLALYRCGRQGEALAVYTDTRRVLDEELGVEPRSELRELHQRILTADPALDPTPAPGPRESAATLPRPAQLPPTVADFTGRREFVTELGERLTDSRRPVMALSAVAGIGGVGKTTLAVHVAHAVRERYPDGQLYVDLQGASPAPMEPTAVLASFLRALGVTDPDVPEGPGERAALFRSLLDGRRVLTLLDNARDAAQIRDLLPGTPDCAVLVTSRTRMVDLAGAHLVDLDVMSPEESLQLFARIVGAERVNSERQAAMDVVAACGFLPLAIRIAAARLAARRTWAVSVLARKLADERRRLDELQAGDQAVKATFELGYGQLEPEQARAFRLLGLVEGPDIPLRAAAALLDRDPEDTEEVLESLVDTSLLESAAPGRYRLHDLVRLFARACAERDETSAAGRAATDRLLDFHLTGARRVFAMERPGDRTVEHLTGGRPVPSGSAESPAHPDGMVFEDFDAAREWLFAEAECLLACARQGAREGRTGKAADLLIAAKDLAETGAFSLQYEQACAVVLEWAVATGDRHAEGRARVSSTHSLSVTGRVREAAAEAAEAARLGTATGDPVARGYGFNDQGIIAIYRSRHEEAEEHLERAVAVFREDGNAPTEASALSNLARVHLNTGRVGSALELAGRAHAIYLGVGATLRLANAKYALGMALTAAGRHTESRERLEEAVEIFREHRQRLWEGMSLFRLGEAVRAAGDDTGAAALAEQALGLLRDIGGDFRRAQVLTLLGRALAGSGQRGRARACWEQALGIFEAERMPEAGEVRDLLDSSGEEGPGRGRRADPTPV